MRTLIQSRKVVFQDRDETTIIPRIEQFLAINSQDREANLEEDFGAFKEEDVEDAEGKDEGHAVYVEGEEPGERDDGELHIGFLKVVPEDWHCFLDEAFEDALVKEGAVHGCGVVAWEEAVAELGEEEEGLSFGGVSAHSLTTALTGI